MSVDPVAPAFAPPGRPFIPPHWCFTPAGAMPAGADWHPWFVAVQYHPEFKSKPTAAHPLFAGFIGAAVDHHAAKHGRAADASGAPAPAEGKKPASRPSKLEA